MDQNNNNTTEPAPAVAAPASPTAATAPTAEIPAVTPAVPVQPMTSPVESVPPVVPPTQDANAPQDPGFAQTKSHNMMFILIGIVILVLVSLVVLFFYRQFTTLTDPSAKVTPVPQVAVPPTTVPVSPTVTPANAEEKELQSIDLGEVDTELTNIEKDLTDL